MSYKHALLDRIANRTAVVSVIGAGYVGLPLAVEFAEAGFSVNLVDVDCDKVQKLNQGESYIADIPTERLKPLVESGKLTATNSYEAIKDTDTVSICVPTPLRKTKDPDMSYVIQAVDSIVEISHPGMLVVLESTTYPGTTEEMVVPKLVENGLEVGNDVFIAFSPERIDPSNKVYSVRNTPRVVGGIEQNSTDIASALYKTAVDEVVEVSSPTAAEMVKLLENSFRAVNIGFANEIALMCDRLGISVWEVIDAAATKPFGFMPFYPGPGLGGHCIPVDPHYLSWKLRTLNYTARFIELASEVNTGMPLYVVDKISTALNDQSKPVLGSKIVVLGVAYKANVSDVRESPALDVISLLLQRRGEVVYHDPYVPQIQIEDGSILHSVEYSTDLLDDADCVVILTDHDAYDWNEILEHSKVLVDTRHATAQIKTDTPIYLL